MIYDYCIIGGGILGLSTAYKLINKFPKANIILLEKEKKVASHQTGRNSGVVHAGIYYKNKSLKSTFCKQGLKEAYLFADQNSINYNKIGKLIVATNDEEESVLENLYKDHKDSVNLSLLSKNQISSIEPNLNCISAILSPDTGIIDWQQFSEKLLEVSIQKGLKILNESNVIDITESDSYVEVKFFRKIEKIRTKKLICCAGLQSDRLAKISGLKTNIKIIPFKGTYFYLNKERSNIFKKLIYPTPNLKTPFLGIHFTKHLNGYSSVGPNASLSLAREVYSEMGFNINDCLDTFFYKGFWKFINKNKQFIFNELNISLSKHLYLKQFKKFYPDLSLSDVSFSKCGIRAQAVDNDGNFVNDFLFAKTKSITHVLNAPSPAATSCFPIAEYIIENSDLH